MRQATHLRTACTGISFCGTHSQFWDQWAHAESERKSAWHREQHTQSERKSERKSAWHKMRAADKERESKRETHNIETSGLMDAGVYK